MSCACSECVYFKGLSPGSGSWWLVSTRVVLSQRLARGEHEVWRRALPCPGSHSCWSQGRGRRKQGQRTVKMSPKAPLPSSPGLVQPLAATFPPSVPTPSWPVSPAPPGSWCPEPGNFPGPRRDKGRLAQAPGQLLPATALIADQMVPPGPAPGGTDHSHRSRPREGPACYQPPAGGTSCCHHSNADTHSGKQEAAPEGW